jgi:hypothetical protein
MAHVPNADVCAAALLNDLVAIDEARRQPDERRALVRSALETAGWLIEQGGGPFELEAIQRIKSELEKELL